VTPSSVELRPFSQIPPAHSVASFGSLEFACIGLRGEQTLDLGLDLINITNRTNFLNPTAGSTQNAADQRLTNFLLLTQLSGGGQPRQAQVSVRIGF
jgi:hypothetical protein